jgi:uncharacterized Zn finger protein
MTRNKGGWGLVEKKALPWWVEHEEELKEPTLDEELTDFDSFWRGNPDELSSFSIETSWKNNDVSLLERVGAPHFLKESSLFIRVLEEIYHEIKRKAGTIEKKHKGV